MNDERAGIRNLEEIIEYVIAPGLKREGFRKRRHSWNRKRGEFVEAITIEKSKYCGPEYDAFTMSAGIFIPWMHEAVWHKQPSFVTEVFCQVRARIGEIVGGFERRAPDKWWTPNHRGDYRAVGDEMGQLVLSHVLPFLASFKTMEDVHSFLDGELKYVIRDAHRTINLALVKKTLGDTQGAVEALTTFINRKPGGWAERAKEVLERYIIGERVGPVTQQATGLVKLPEGKSDRELVEEALAKRHNTRRNGNK